MAGSFRPGVIVPKEQLELFTFYLQLAAFVLGPLVALIPVLIWEIRIKPKRERQQTALSLTRELSFNSDQLESVVKADLGDKHIALPIGVQLSTLVFTALVSNLAELPSELGTRVIFLYNEIERFNGLAKEHDIVISRFKLSQLDSHGVSLHQQHMEMLAEAIRDVVKLIRLASEDLLPDLRKLIPGKEGSTVALAPPAKG